MIFVFPLEWNYTEVPLFSGRGPSGFSIGSCFYILRNICIINCASEYILCFQILRRKEIRDHPITRSFGYDGSPRFSCNGKTLYYSCGCSTFTEYTVIPENSCVKVRSTIFSFQ